MRINLIPLYARYTLVGAIMIVFAFPPLIAGSMMLEIERVFHWPFFDAARGGDPLLWQHLEWAQEMPGKPWGIRSIPEIDGRYPLWAQRTCCAISTRVGSIFRTLKRGCVKHS